MNVFGKREKRGWRKARKRGVSPIIATILLVAITVVLAAVLYVLISSLTTGGASTVPIGTTFTLGAPAQSTTCSVSTAGSCYTVTIESAGSSATTSNIHFSVLKSGAATAFGKVVVIGNGASFSAPSATYTYTTGAWTGSSLPWSFNSTQTLVVFWDGTLSLSGNSLQAIGVGALSGTENYALP